MWPPKTSATVSDALKADVPISPELDHWTSPERLVSAVKDVVCCGNVVVFLLDGSSDLLKGSNLHAWHFPQKAQELPQDPATLESQGARPLTLSAWPTAPQSCSRIWPATPTSFLALCGEALWRVEMAYSQSILAASADADHCITVPTSQMLTLPPNTCSLDCCASSDGGIFCAMLVSPAGKQATGPTIVIPGSSLSQVPAAKLFVFDCAHGLKPVADVPRLSEQLVISKGQRRLCVWRAMLNEVPEEAERGEFFGMALDSSEVACLTQGAGRVGGAAVSDDGRLVLLQANFAKERPITTHMALVLVIWPAGHAQPLPERRMLVEGDHLLNFDFLHGASTEDGSCRFIETRLNGVEPATTLWHCGADGVGDPHAVETLAAPVLSRSMAVAQGTSKTIVYGTEHPDALPRVAVTGLEDGASAMRFLRLPQPHGVEGLSIEKVTYEHGGHQVTALLCERVDPPCSDTAPLLVHVHGGPATGVVNSKRMASDLTRYPYRHMLVAGYRIFQPMFRGTLGFGDAWAQANIGSQGSLQSDLGDIIAGMRWLNEKHPRLKGTVVPARTGIYGGSYGGYMTIRAMSMAPDHFAAGIAMYGFVHNRFMTYEGGDFTYEDEYIQPASGLDPDFEIELVEEEATKDASPCHASPRSAASSTRRRASSDDSRAPSDVWPLPREMEASDVFNGLHHINKPLLLMHGEKDDICPLSQSQIVFHMLEKQGVPTGLLVYPGEGHGFDKPEHRQDRDRRMLAWWREHLPGALGDVPDFRSAGVIST